MAVDVTEAPKRPGLDAPERPQAAMDSEFVRKHHGQIPFS
jgi:hypothetical protein